MNFDQFNTLLDIAEFRVFEDKGKHFVGVWPKKECFAVKVDEITQSFKNYPFSLEWFKKKAETYMPIRRAKTKEILHKLQISSLSFFAHLNTDESLEFLYKIMPAQPTVIDIERLKPYKEKIAQLMFNLKIPKNFLKQEEILAFKFVNRIQTIPNIKENIKNWQDLKFSDQKKCLEEIVDVFVKTYEISPIKVSFFNEEDYQKERQEQGFDFDKVSPTGYALTDKHEICFCKDRMSLCDNFVPVYLTFHEALHISQKERDFSEFNRVEKLFDERLSFFQLISEDAYLLSPIEIHAYAMDKLVKESLQDVLGVPFIPNKYDMRTKKAVDDANNTAHVLYAYQLRTLKTKDPK